MSARVSRDDPALLQLQPPPASEVPVAPIGWNGDPDLGNGLPADHPAWSKDVVSLSHRARALLERVRPVAIRVLTMWDHRVRSLVVGTRRFSVDASGCYRLD